MPDLDDIRSKSDREEMDISIIIPTHDRRALLLCTLKALSNQTVDPKSFEVIVVADGCQDGTAAAVTEFHAPYRLTLVEQPDSGPATARNRGAKEATAPLLMFLDDDVEPSSDLVESHLEAHRKCPDLVVLGYTPLKDFASRKSRLDPFEVIHKLWWSIHFSNKLDTAHRINFCDIVTLNISLRTNLFRELHGFDENFLGTYEDYELGLRLMKQRPHFRYLSKATGLHQANMNQEGALRRHFFTGQYHVLMIQKHPELSRIFPVGFRPASDISCKYRFSIARRYTPKILFQLIWSYPIVAEQLASGLNFLLCLAKDARIDKLYYRLLDFAQSYSYWCGVRKEIGSLSALEKLDSLAEQRQKFNEIEIDLQKDLKHLDNILATRQIDSIRISFGEVPIGQIDHIVGAESLRAPHVYEALINCFGLDLLKAITTEISDIKSYQDSNKVYGARALALLAKLSNAYRERLILLEPGWHLAENWDGIPIHWMKRRARLLYYSETKCHANLNFQTFSFYRPRTLEIYANDMLVSRQMVPKEFIEVLVRIHINEGINIFELLVPDGCERPCKYPEFDRNDTRCLSLATKCIMLQPIREESSRCNQ